MNWNESLIVFIIAVVVVIGLAWLLNPRMMNPTVDGFHGGDKTPQEMISPEEVDPRVQMNVHAEEENIPESMRMKPEMDPTTGTMMDGPGFERGEIEGAPEIPTSVPSNYYLLNDGAGGEMSIQNNLCSKSCCSEQWPTPFKMKYDPYVCQNKDKFVP